MTPVADNTVSVVVGFPHKGEDGKDRKVGDTLKVSEAEYRLRGPDGDGFMKAATAKRGASSDS